MSIQRRLVPPSALALANTGAGPHPARRMVTPPDLSPRMLRHSRGGPRRWPAVLLALVPVLALTLAIPLVNRQEPRVLGLPCLLAWIVGWILLTPLCMAAVYRLDQGRRHPR